MKDLRGTTGLYIEGEDVPLNDGLNGIYQATVKDPYLNFLFIWKVGEMYCALSIEYRFGRYRCIVNGYEDMSEASGIMQYSRKDRLNLNIKLNKELVTGNRNLTIRLIRWIYKTIKGKSSL